MMTKEEILKIAEDEFFCNGYSATSTAVIARRAGVTHAMVNYYYKSKEKLFATILEVHIMDIMNSLKDLLDKEGDVISKTIDIACVLFDKLNSDRRFPFLISDISRTHPSFLLQYKETFDKLCLGNLDLHTEKLEQCIAEGKISKCTIRDIYNTVGVLTTAPFFCISLLENISGYTPEQIDEFLALRREEMIRILKSRYSVGSS